MSDNILEEKKFLLEEIIQLSVLTHAEVFQGFSLETFFKKISDAEAFAVKELSPLSLAADQSMEREEDRISLPGHIRIAWNQIRDNGWSELLDEDGRHYPETVSAAISESFFTNHPGVSLILGITLEVAKIIERYATFPEWEVWLQKLRTCQWSGVFSLAEPSLENEWTGTLVTAKKSGDMFKIRGIKDFVAGGGHDLTETQVHIVKAQIEDSGKAALFAVPSRRMVNDDQVENDITMVELNPMVGHKDIPFCKMSYGDNDNCLGYLISDEADTVQSILDQLKGFRLLLVIQNIAQLNRAKQYMEGAIISHTGQADADGQNSDENDIGLYEFPHVLEIWIKVNVYLESFRAAALQAAFFDDCAQFGAEKQRQYFSDLELLYITILKVYASQTCYQVVRDIEDTLGGFGQHAGTLIEQVSNDIRVSSVLAGLNQNVAEDVLLNLLTKYDGRLFQQLMTHFQTLDTGQAKSGPVREAIAIWQEFQGGLIVFLDDLKQLETEGNLDGFRVYANDIVTVLGDVILCYHLISQAIAAEKKLEDSGVNFFNLQNDILNHPDQVVWYNKIIAVEYFAAHVLSLKENLFHLIQRSPETVPAYIPITG